MKKTLFILLVALGMTMTLSNANSYADGVLGGLDHTIDVSGDMQINMDPGSSLMITQADGNVTLVENPADIPANLLGASVDVFDGCARAVTENREVSLCVTEDRGTAKAVLGDSAITTNRGIAVSLNEGDEYHFTLDEGETASEEELAPPTAASGETLGSPLGGFAPFDSTTTTTDDGRDNPVSPSNF